MKPATGPGGGTGSTNVSAETSPSPGGVRADRGWLPIVAAAALFVALFFPFFEQRWHFYGERPRYSHCVLLPAVSALWVWERWDTLKVLPRRPSMLGLGLTGLAVLAYLLGRLSGANVVMHAGFLLTVVGLVWGVLGARQLRAYAFPVGYLFLTMPLPTRWDDSITLPLQGIATSVSEAVFDALGWVVVRQGNVLQLPGLKLLVEDACSGVHSLYALVSLGAAWVFFNDRPAWMKVTLILAAVPISVVANSVRVVGSGVLAYKVDPSWAQGGSHYTAGMLVFAIGAALLLGLDWCLKPDEYEPDGTDRA